MTKRVIVHIKDDNEVVGASSNELRAPLKETKEHNNTSAAVRDGDKLYQIEVNTAIRIFEVGEA